MVLRGGENIASGEVESVLYRYPGVTEAAVFSVPDEAMGEEVGVAIHLSEGGIGISRRIARVQPWPLGGLQNTQIYLVSRRSSATQCQRQVPEKRSPGQTAVKHCPSDRKDFEPD